jgi:hypothetical protein
MKTNGELFYDPNMDDEDQTWVDDVRLVLCWLDLCKDLSVTALNGKIIILITDGSVPRVGNHIRYEKY